VSAARLAALACLLSGCSGATCAGPPPADTGIGSDAAAPGTDAAGDAAPGTDAAPRPVDVVVNELLATNAATLTDEAGEYDDWLELYNTTAAPVDLTGWTITDDLGLEVPWPFPAGTTIAGNGFLLLWCDMGAGQGPLHADFRLSSAGETIDLIDSTGAIADEVAFPLATADVSWGRLPDGASTQQELTPPTPGAPNG
jgi:hypothetical protein